MEQQPVNFRVKMSPTEETAQSAGDIPNRNLVHRHESSWFIGVCYSLAFLACLTVMLLWVISNRMKTTQTVDLSGFNYSMESSYLRLPKIYGRWTDEQLAGRFPQYNPKKRSRSKVMAPVPTTTTIMTTTTTMATTTKLNLTTRDENMLDLTKDAWNYNNHEAEGERFDRYLTGKGYIPPETTPHNCTRGIKKRLQDRIMAKLRPRTNAYNVKAYDWGREVWSNRSRTYVYLIAEPLKTTKTDEITTVENVKYTETDIRETEMTTVRHGEMTTNEISLTKTLVMASDFEYTYMEEVDPHNFAVLLNNKSDFDPHKNDLSSEAKALEVLDNLQQAPVKSAISRNMASRKGNGHNLASNVTSASMKHVEAEVPLIFRLAADVVTAYDNVNRDHAAVTIFSSFVSINNSFTKVVKSREKVPAWWMGTSRTRKRSCRAGLEHHRCRAGLDHHHRPARMFHESIKRRSSPSS